MGNLSDAQSHIDGLVVASIIQEFHREFRDTYTPDTMASSLCAVGPLQSMIGLAIAKGYIAAGRLALQKDEKA